MNVMITILIVICFFWQYIAFTNSDVCRSKDGNLQCCPGFVWNILENQCKQCDAGKIGPRCEIDCPYPFYGKQCLSKCNCSKDWCGSVEGCKVWTNQDPLTGHSVTSSRAKFNETSTGTLTTFLSETENEDTSMDNKISLKWLFVTTVPFCVIIAIIITALMFKHFRQRRKFVSVEAAYTVPTPQRERHIYALCDEGQKPSNPKGENVQVQENVSNPITDEDGYLTVVEKKDN